MSPNTATTRTPGRKTNAELANELNAAKAINEGLLCLLDAIHLCATSVPRSAEGGPMSPELERARQMLITIGAFTDRKDPDVVLMPTFLASFAAHIERQAAAPLTYLPYAADDGGWISGPCTTTGDDAIELVQP